MNKNKQENEQQKALSKKQKARGCLKTLMHLILESIVQLCIKMQSLE